MDNQVIKYFEDQIVYNAIQTPDGTILESQHRHDYRTHIDSTNGKTYMVDGGLDYLRRRGEGYQELALTDQDPIEEIREVFKWGTYGKKGDQKLHWILLKNMSDAHIKNIMKDGYHKHLDLVFSNELKYRKLNNINIGD